ncbi:hypothetical protein Tco_1511664 [Tanacetum coccineum]
MRKGKAKVAWDVVCLPKDEGGLGVKRLDLFNKALMSSHVWKLLVRKDSLWVKWIHTYKIKHCNFWDIPCHGNMTWGWRKILQLRPLVQEFIWYKIGNGYNISIWHDRWCPLSLLANFVSTRDMYRAGLNMSSIVSDVVHDGSLAWPPELGVKYPILNSIYVINVAPNSPNKLEWRTHSRAVKKFVVSTVCQAIRTRDVKVWKHMTDFAGLSQKHYNIYDVVSSILLIAKRRTSDIVIIKLVIAASPYFLWQERNERLFKNNKRSMV